VNWLFLFLEISAALIFVAVAVVALQHGRLPFLELISAALFGLLLEEGDQLIFRTYHYSADWVLMLDKAPLVIGLTWALLIAGAMRITDALGVNRRLAPFVDAVLVVALDLAFDAIAIRIGMWTWTGIDPTVGWFGVPAGNFYAWLFVTLGFSAITRLLRDHTARRRWMEWLQLLVPIPAFVILIASIVPFAWVMVFTGLEPGEGLWMFAIALAVFMVLAWRAVFGPNRAPADGQMTAIVALPLAFFTRLSIHGFFLLELMVLGIGVKYPILLVVSVTLFILEFPLAKLVHLRLAEAAADATAAAGEPEPLNREPSPTRA
jgi:hypothetical protein